MKTFQRYITKITCILLAGSVCLTSCKKEKDDRAYDEVMVVGVKVNNKLLLPKVNNKVATIDEFKPGTPLNELQLEVFVTNGELLDMENNNVYDCRKPMPVKIRSFNGTIEDWTFRFVSAPAIANFSIEGVSVAKSDIYLGTKALTVSVPKNTDLTKLKVTMSFLNGTLLDFQNGVEQDYTNKKTISVKGVDDETIYTYNFRITTEPVGPASILGMTINGVQADSVVTTDNVVQPYVSSLMNFVSSEVMLNCGIGNEIDSSFPTTGINLVSGSTTVKITGTDGIEKEFTLACPKIVTPPLFSKTSEELFFGKESPQALGISGRQVLVANYQSNNIGEAPVGVNYYDFTGKHLGNLDYTGTNINTGAVYGIRKMTTDDSGNVLCVQLGAGAGVGDELAIYRWKTPSAKGEKLITYSGKSLGLNYGARTAGINVTGSVDGDAIIAVPMAQKKEVAVFTIKGGVVQPNAKVYQSPYVCAYYYSIQPMPIGSDGFVGALNGKEVKGLVMFNNTMNESFKLVSEQSTSDCKTLKHKDRIYLAYTLYAAGKGAFFRVCDITDGQQASFDRPIFEHLMSSKETTSNETMDAELSVIDGKLYAAFLCTNIGIELYRLEK